MSYSKAFENDKAKSSAESESEFNYDSNYRFYKFYKQYDEFEEMPLDSKYNRRKEFNKLLIKFKSLRPKHPKTQLKKERIMKIVAELYEKYYNTYKNNYDADELSEAKKKTFDHKQFQLFLQTDKKLKQDGETKTFIKQIENKEKGVDKKAFTKYFSYEPTALVNKLLGENTQDLRKRLDNIKQQKMKLNKDERNSTDNKNENGRLNTILSLIDRIYHFCEYKFFRVKNKMN